MVKWLKINHQLNAMHHGLSLEFVKKTMNEINFTRRNEVFFHLSVRTVDMKSLPLNPEAEFKKINSVLNNLNKRLKIKFYAYVYMFDHFHVLFGIDNQWMMSNGVEWLKSSIIGYLRSNQVLVNSYFFSKISSYFGFLETYKYIYANPLKEGLCESLLDYPFSSLSWVLGRRRGCFEVIDLTSLVLNPNKWIYEFEMTALEWV